jgi:hypothetical protein
MKIRTRQEMEQEIQESCEEQRENYDLLSEMTREMIEWQKSDEYTEYEMRLAGLDGYSNEPPKSDAFLAGYRECTKTLQAMVGRGGIPRPNTNHRRRWKDDWQQFCKGWAERIKDKRRAEAEW